MRFVLNPYRFGVPYPLGLTVTNPGAETGDTTGWTLLVGNPAATPSTGAGRAPRSGSYFFYMGTNAHGTMTQTIAIPTAYQSDVDANFVTATLSGYFGTYIADTGQFYINALNASGVCIGLIGSDWLQTGVNNNWYAQSISMILPAGTRSLKIGFSGHLRDGATDDASWDDIVLSIDRRAPGYPMPVPIINGNAETGDTTGWTTVSGSPTVTQTSGDGTYARSGKWYFYPGNTDGVSSRQDVSIPSLAIADVDADLLELNYEYYQCCTGTDQQRIRVEFYSSGMSLLGSLTPAYASDGGANAWVQKLHTVNVPVNTRTIRFINDCDRVAGTSNDGYVDDIRAYLDTR